MISARPDAPCTARVATLIGLAWSFAPVASGMIFTHGMTTVAGVAATDNERAVLTSQAVEPIAQGLGGAGGEVLGGLWVLLVSCEEALPKPLAWLGVVSGAIASPPSCRRERSGAFHRCAHHLNEIYFWYMTTGGAHER